MINELIEINNPRWILEQCRKSLTCPITQTHSPDWSQTSLGAYCNLDLKIGKYGAIGYVYCQQVDQS